MVKIPQNLIFSREEFQRRVSAVQAGMTKTGLDVLFLFSPEHIFYLSGYQTFGYFSYQALIVPVKGEPVLVLRFLETFLARLYSWVNQVVPWDDHEDPIAVTVQAVKERGLAKARIGVED